jgi:hypothetical protein
MAGASETGITCRGRLSGCRVDPRMAVMGTDARQALFTLARVSVAPALRYWAGVSRFTMESAHVDIDYSAKHGRMSE